MVDFNYQRAFSRSIGWLTRDELIHLKKKKIAIAGLGGVGGSHLLTLTRLGIGGFHLADFDHFELENFNRQAGANLSSIGRPKIDVLKEMALQIDPELDLQTFPEGVNLENIAQFLESCDLYVDGLDFFALDLRRAIFQKAKSMNIPAITCAPLGMGAALLVFMPDKMDFDTYFELKDCSPEEQLFHFLIGLSPDKIQQKYLVDPASIDLKHHRGPSTPMGCEMCASVTATTALKILLKRGKVLSAPHSLVFDAYENRIKHCWRPFGTVTPFSKMTAWLNNALRSGGHDGST
ncbi:MAG: ThiF family adenylyltransferase [Gammaproteobacteria bacterium]